ncbi:hypothetical protein AMJ52_08795 [candidate division TA06 bacterium DG_78]|uniref:Uncharacterized protein n=1 Tax=candidate division TA06 bacterium DG_78 TaxID=1703772 RepID=A0A0S7Y8V8_UNCT6|nr:MAG: hypothetical protein AMJ52_08795 [candidate division TA06 bacterium DG_78]
MRGLFLTTIIASMAINIGLYAQEEEMVQEKPKIELSVVYEKTFDDTVVDVIFDTATVSIEEAKQMGWKEGALTIEDKAKGKVLVSYPKVVFVSRGRELGWYVPESQGSSYYVKELRFYDKYSRLQRKLDIRFEEGFEFIHLSPQKKYILVSKMPSEYNPEYSGGSLYDCVGKRIWEIAGPTPIAVSDEGYAVAAHLDWQVPPNPGGDFYIYDSEGKLISTIENPDKNKTSPLFGEYSKDGDYAVISFHAGTVPPTIFLLITKEGKILWQKELPENSFPGRSEEIDILPNKGIGVTNAFFINWQGNLKWKYSLNLGGNKGCIFSQDEMRFYVYTTYGYLYSFDVYSGSIIWEHREPWSPQGIPRLIDKVPWFVEMQEQAQYIVVKGAITNWTSWHSSKVFLFDSRTGELKIEIEYPDKKIFLSSHNGIIFVIDAANNKVEGLKIEEE